MRGLRFALVAGTLAFIGGCTTVGHYQVSFLLGSETLHVNTNHRFTYNHLSDTRSSTYSVSGTWAKVGPNEFVTIVTSPAEGPNKPFPHGEKWRVTMRGVVAESQNTLLKRNSN